MRTATSRPGSAGFTLIELLVGLAIIAAALTLTMPYLSRLAPGATLDAATNEIAASLRAARASAIRDNHPVSVAVDGGKLTVEFQPDGSSSGGALELGTGTRARQIAVDPLTGRVMVRRP